MNPDSPIAGIEAELEAMRKRCDEHARKAAHCEDMLGQVVERLERLEDEARTSEHRPLPIGIERTMKPLTIHYPDDMPEEERAESLDALKEAIGVPTQPLASDKTPLPEVRYRKMRPGDSKNPFIDEILASGKPLASAKSPHEHEPWPSDVMMVKAHGMHHVYCVRCNEPIEKVEAGGHADAVWRLVKPWEDVGDPADG